MKKVAYFCMEYGLETSFKIYAGGLGILAGDYLKGAKDHGYPIIGIGLKWKQGYTDQRVAENGKPYDSYHNYNYEQFLEDTGVKVTVEIRHRDVVCKVWKTEAFGNAPLYLLDTDIPENNDTWITGQLYGWFAEERVAQEMVLGIGGVRAIRALGLDIDVYHFNEGHALFAGFELLREKMDEGYKFKKALAKVRKNIVFTTHTPVIQGNESHPIRLLMYMGANLELKRKQLEYIGGGEPFNMTVGALNMAKKSNAVAKLHAITANKMWEHVEDIPEIIPITNAIHRPTWVDQKMLEYADNPDQLWERHQYNKTGLINFVKMRTGQVLNPEHLIIGFSRRAVPYKRADLIFSQPELMEPFFKSGKIQIIFSGKAHPLDDQGKAIVENLVSMTKKYPNSVVFLENYDMTIGAQLVRGSDIWLNNPRRPMEASGTSGMKAAMNGVLNLSVLDGWWPEACENGITGWQIGDGFESEDAAIQHAHDSEALFKVLLEEVLPTYYDHRAKWVNMMAASIEATRDEFDVKRMLRDYYELLY
jgi:glycogen phosphorylase